MRLVDISVIISNFSKFLITFPPSRFAKKDSTNQSIWKIKILTYSRKDSSRNNDNSFNLNELLKLDVFADIIAHYEEHGRFDEMTQKRLMKILCDELLKGPRLSNEAISQISNDVCLTFVTEKKVKKCHKC